MRVRPARAKDLEACSKLNGSYTTDRVWQMEAREEVGVLTTSFRVARLPREILVRYPRHGEDLLAGWKRCNGFQVAVEGREIRGYVGIISQVEHGIARVGDLVVGRRWRRESIGTALLNAASRWGRDNGLVRLVVEVQTKNFPAIRFFQSRGLTFCGYNDHYWPSQDIALFFGQSLR
jgi:ribosomal protein S18 acetylase RimI-like enzyme